MTSAPATSVTLLYRIRDRKDESAWSVFTEIYEPLILAYARHHGLQISDAADVSQDVLQRVLQNIDSFEYDPSKGRFSGWLLTITRNCIRDFCRRGPRDRGSGRSTIMNILQNQSDNDDDAELWQHSERQRVSQWALQRVQKQFESKTWRAFEMTAILGQSVQSTATELDISSGAVYIARSRVIARVRETIERLEKAEM